MVLSLTKFVLNIFSSLGAKLCFRLKEIVAVLKFNIQDSMEVFEEHFNGSVPVFVAS